MGVRIGDLRDQVMLMRKTMTPTGAGGFTEVWGEVDTVWAQVVGINGREAIIGQALQGISFFKIVIRYRGDVTDDMQISFQPYVAPSPLMLNIRSISDPDGRRERLLILADTGSAQATA